jgi:hypothetical protein
MSKYDEHGDKAMGKRLGDVQVIIRRASDDRIEVVGVNSAAVGVGKTKVEALRDFVECLTAMVKASLKNDATVFFEPSKEDQKEFRLAAAGKSSADVLGTGVFSITLSSGGRKPPLVEAERLALA